MASNYPNRDKSKPVNIIASLIIVLIIGFGLRLTAYKNVITEEGINFTGTDAYYHLLRAKDIVQNYPHVKWHDFKMNYPEGASIIWPPLFDHLIATSAIIIGLGEPSPKQVEWVAALIPPLIGTITLILVVCIGKLLININIGLMAALIMAALPAHLNYSQIGRTDQHVAETFFCCLVFLAFLCSIKSQHSLHLWLSRSFLGLGITLSFWNWPGSGIYLFFLILFVVFWQFSPSANKRSIHKNARELTWGTSIAVFLLALSLILLGPAGKIAEMSLSGLTGFQILLVAISAAFGGFLTAIERVKPTSTIAGNAFKIIVAALVPLFIACIIFPGFSEEIIRAFSFFNQSNPWYSTISEFYPLFFSGYASFNKELIAAAMIYGLGLFFSPFIVIPFLVRWREDKKERYNLFFLFSWFCLFFFMALLRKRFSYYFAVPFSICLSFGLYFIIEAIVRRWKSRRLAYVIVSVIIIVMLAPGIAGVVLKSFFVPDDRIELFDTLKWLKEQKSASNREAVIANWPYGHYIQYISGKPVVVNPFGTDLGRTAMEDTAKFFLSKNFESLEELIARRKIGFILIDDPLNYYYLTGFMSKVKKTEDKKGEKGGRVAHSNKSTKWDKIVASRLYYRDGQVDSSYLSNANFMYRLVFESPSDLVRGRRKTKKYKIFEVVPGARLIVKGLPGRVITITIQLISNQNRHFKWKAYHKTNDKGIATIRLPYATDNNRGVLAEGLYSISDGNNEEDLSITDYQIQSGAEVVLDI